MHRGGFIRGLLVALVLIAIIGGTAYFAYGAGVAQGVLDSGKQTVPATGFAPNPFYGLRPLGFGFGALRCLFPLLFVFLIFSLVRGIFWHGHWGHGMRHGIWESGQGLPPMFEEWHKRSHESKPAETK